jgi:WD40 repeat protein
VDYFAACSGCAERYPSPPEALVTASTDLLEALAWPLIWGGVRGTPVTRRRDTGLHFVHEDFPCAFPVEAPLIDVVPDRARARDWMGLTQSGYVLRLDFSDRKSRELYRLVDPEFAIDDEVALYVSPRSDFGCICQTSGQFGLVFELTSGAITCRLDRGDYRPDNSRYPFAFFESEGRTFIVAGTDWNRLDIIDPANGAILTERGPTSYETGEPRPERYLDYFHGQLLVSPDGAWIVDNGWVWSPDGVVRSWNLQTWRNGNVWESEDGGSLKQLAIRAYYWDGPICWTDDATVAVWGWGSDGEWLVPAVRLFDVSSGNELSWFPGPEVRAATAWPPKKVPPSLFFDEYLFSVSESSGIAIWDLSSGERLHQDGTLFPVQYHPVSKEFLSVTPDGYRLSRLAGR